MRARSSPSRRPADSAGSRLAGSLQLGGRITQPGQDVVDLRLGGAELILDLGQLRRHPATVPLEPVTPFRRGRELFLGLLDICLGGLDTRPRGGARGFVFSRPVDGDFGLRRRRLTASALASRCPRADSMLKPPNPGSSRASVRVPARTAAAASSDAIAARKVCTIWSPTAPLTDSPFARATFRACATVFASAAAWPCRSERISRSSPFAMAVRMLAPSSTSSPRLLSSACASRFTRCAAAVGLRISAMSFAPSRSPPLRAAPASSFRRSTNVARGPAYNERRTSSSVESPAVIGQRPCVA